MREESLWQLQVGGKTIRVRKDHPFLVYGEGWLAMCDLQLGDLLLTNDGQIKARAVRAINSVLAATYWEMGRRIIEFEQQGAARADDGERLVERLSRDLSKQHWRGFFERNVWNMKAFYLGWQLVNDKAGR